MDYGYLAKMASVADKLNDMLKRKSGHIVSKVMLETTDGEQEIRASALSSVCIEQIEQALIAEAERYGYRIKGYVEGDPEANVLYKD
ncbi:hypothetical protein FACS189490_03960 [Clostridia bacterium]|nr:hypothetical protein FACS189490_03960 [Clostridia bacterium]